MWQHWLPSFEHGGFIGYLVLFFAATIESTAFIGLFFPGTTLVVFVGYLASRGMFNVINALWIVAVGGIIGDAISYFLGRRSENLVSPDSRFVKPELITKAHLFFSRHGAKSVFFARFIGPLRPIVPFVAGAAKMDARRFFFFNVIGGAAAAFVYILIGYYFGNAWHAYRHIFRRFEPLIIIAVVAIAARWWWRSKFLNDKKPVSRD